MWLREERALSLIDVGHFPSPSFMQRHVFQQSSTKTLNNVQRFTTTWLHIHQTHQINTPQLLTNLVCFSLFTLHYN